jgi:hypothetical protein
LHMPIMRLQQQTVMPFIIVQQLHMPPAIMVQRFWSMPADIAYSQVQVIFMPPGQFSMVMVQRGTIIMFMPVGIVLVPPIISGPIVGAPIPVMPIPARSVSVVIIPVAPGCKVRSVTGPTPGPQLGPSLGKRSPGYKEKSWKNM